MNHKRFIKQLQRDNIDMTLIRSELSRLQQNNSKNNLKNQLLLIIRSSPVQVMLSALVLIDAIIVIAEIILEIHVVKRDKTNLEGELTKTQMMLNFSLRELINCPNIQQFHYSSDNPNQSHYGSNKTLGAISECCTLLPPTFSFKHECSDSSLNCSNAFQGVFMSLLKHWTPETVLHSAENKEDGNHLHDVSMILHYISIGILGFFVCEVGIKIICVGKKFLNEKFEVVDALIIITSFMADILFVSLAPQEILVMIVFLLWRIVRVINGLLMHEKQRDEFRVQIQKRARRLSEMKVENLRIKKELYEKHIFSLQDLCKQFGASPDQINNCKPKYMNPTKVQTNNALKSMAAMTTGMFSQLVKAGPTSLGSNTSSLLASPVVDPRVNKHGFIYDQASNNLVASNQDLSDSQFLIKPFDEDAPINKISDSDYKTIVKLFSEPSMLPKKIKSTAL